VGDRVHVEADIFADGHEELGAVIRYRREDQAEWTETPLRELGNDRWRGHFDVPDLARYRYTVEAWVDRFATWYRDLGKRLEAEQDVSVELVIGADLAEHAAGSASWPGCSDAGAAGGQSQRGAYGQESERLEFQLRQSELLPSVFT